MFTSLKFDRFITKVEIRLPKDSKNSERNKESINEFLIMVLETRSRYEAT